MKIHRDFIVLTRDGVRLPIDLFLPPQSDTKAPLIVMIHGGGWISGDRTMFYDEAQYWAQQGYGVACISYRLAPLYPFPNQLADVQDAIAALRAEAHSLPIDPDQFIVFGNSAGGHLATLVAVTEKNYGQAQEGTLPNAVVSLCGLMDLRNPREVQFPIGWSFLEQFLGSLEDADRCAEASPAQYVRPGLVPMLLLHGTDDDIVPVQQSIDMANQLEAAGGRVNLKLLKGEFHSFSFSALLAIREEMEKFFEAIGFAPTIVIEEVNPQ